MAKALRDIISKKLEGVKSSSIEAGSTGNDPGVDYDAKAGDDRKFVAKHKIEKHADRVGNKDVPYKASDVKYALDTPQNSRMGNDEKASKAANEEVIQVDEVSRKKLTHYLDKTERPSEFVSGGTYTGKDRSSGRSLAFKKLSRVKRANVPATESACNHTGSGVNCDVHGTDDCAGSNSKKKLLLDKNKKVAEEVELDEISGKGSFKNAYGKTEKLAHQATSDLNNLVNHKNVDQYHKMQNRMRKSDELRTAIESPKGSQERKDALKYAKNYQKEDALDEVINKSTPTSEVIDDFVHSDNPKFNGKSKKERIKMALGTKYGMMKKEEYIIERVIKKIKNNKEKRESAPADTPMTYPSGNVGDNSNSGRL